MGAESTHLCLHALVECGPRSAAAGSRYQRVRRKLGFFPYNFRTARVVSS